MPDALTVVIAEDSALLREGLIRLLGEVGYTVAAAVGDADALLAAVSDSRPDLAIVDVRLPPQFTEEGLRAAVELRRRFPELPVLVVSQHITVTHLDRLLADGRGGIGYLLKDRVTGFAELVEAADRVRAGGTVLDPEVIAELLVRRRTDPLDTLTPRERHVLALVAEGRTNAAIADQLRMTERAVDKHVSSIFVKLGLLPSDDDNRRVLAVLQFLRGRDER
jgi:DNA-binding NarL/FixJ family response regulator